MLATTLIAIVIAAYVVPRLRADSTNSKEPPGTCSEAQADVGEGESLRDPAEPPLPRLREMDTLAERSDPKDLAADHPCAFTLFFDASPGTALEAWIDAGPQGHLAVLKYLVECALTPTDWVAIRYRGTVRPLASGIANLGPSLVDGELNTNDQEWVSACLLARINATGDHVPLDLVARYPGFREPSDPNVFNVREAAYFGNLFQEPVAAYVWLPAARAVRGCTKSGDCGVIQPTGAYAARVYGARRDIDAGTECYVGKAQERQRLRWGSDVLVPLDFCIVGPTGERYDNVMTVLVRGR